jgi:ribulose-phosphate 3-epimerase
LTVSSSSSRAVRIGASILTADFSCLRRDMEALEEAGIDYFHVDVMDGQFVPAITLGPHVVSGMRRATLLPLDVHLMVVEPEKQIEAFGKAGSDGLAAHVEAMVDPEGFFNGVRTAGMQVGISLTPDTLVAAVEPFLSKVDQVLVMSVQPGKGGQPFMESALSRIAELRTLIDRANLAVDIAVDGGINEQTAPRVAAAGATMLVVGTALLDQREDLRGALSRIRAAIANHTLSLRSQD